MKLIAFALLLLSLAFPLPTQATDTVAVGGKLFTEQRILVRLLTLMYQAAGYDVTEQVDFTSLGLRRAQLAGKIDVCWEYTGTAYKAYHKKNDPTVYTNAEKIYSEVKSLDAKLGLTWLDMAHLNNTYALAVAPHTAEASGWQTLSALAADLRTKQQPIKFGISYGFYQRPDGFKRLAQYYSFPIPTHWVKKMENSAIHGALMRKQIDVGMVYTTDAKIEQHQLQLLQDDKKFFPVYKPAVVIQTALLVQQPRLGEIANHIAARLDTTTMIHLNYLVDIEKQDITAVAKHWLQTQGWLP